MRIILLLIAIFGPFGATDIMAQSTKYDGDWNNVFESLGVNRKTGEHGYGTGKRIYRIQTIEGKTTIRAKVLYPMEDNYQYYKCIVTSCNDTALTWETETSNYWDEESSKRNKVTFYCKLLYDSGTLRAETYLVQREYNQNGTLEKLHKYGEKSFTLYKDNDDW